MVRLSVIGCGRIGRIHASNAAAHPGARLVALSDADAGAAAALAAATGARVASVEEATSGADVDAVLVCAPTDVHAELVERAARAGKAVFCEKPLDLDLSRAKALVAVVEALAGSLMVGFNRRFDPSFADLKRRLDAGAIGDVEQILIVSRDPAPPPISYIERSGGLFRDMAIHDLDMARFLLGEEPAEVRAVGAALVDPAIGRAGDVDTATILLTTASGRSATILNSRRAAYGYDQRVEVLGSRGMLRADNRRATTVEEAGAEGFRTDPSLPFFLERYAEAYWAELDAFVRMVANGGRANPSGEDGVRAQALADAATEAWKTGRAVPLRD